MKAINHVNTYDFQNYHSNRYLVFDHKIVHTGPAEDLPKVLAQYNIPEDKVIDGKGKLLLPGLALCHTHIYSTFARGLALPFNPKNFVELLEQLWWKIDGALTKEMVYSSALVSGLGYIRNGITSVIDHHASGKDILGTLAQIKRALVDDLGLRGMSCFETSDRFDISSCIKENITNLESSQRGEWGGHFGMHASMTLSDDSLREIKKSLGDYPIHIHVAESTMDMEDCLSRSKMTLIKRLDKFGLINRDSLIVHGIYLDDEEMELIAERGAYMVLNPSSNMNNGVGLPDYKKMKSHGLKVLLGNDGMSSAVVNEWQHLLVGMHHRYQDPTAFGLDDLGAIINNGYDYLNGVLGTKLGRLEKGYEADFQLLDYNPPTPLDGDNGLGHLFYGQAFAFRPSHLWAKGELKLKDYRLLADEEAIHEQSRVLSTQLWESLR
ncbi:MAG: amidohydrolase family protein [Spirochaetales bacterium]|nr:amidohydrolase family protein [Spirochaetales bacterium]